MSKTAPRTASTSPAERSSKAASKTAAKSASKPAAVSKAARKRFLAELSRSGIVSLAAEVAGVAPRALIALKAQDPAFAADWDEALMHAADLLESEARRRAYEGWHDPVFYQGQPVAQIRKYSDRLLIFLLKAEKPEKFAERAVSRSGEVKVQVEYADELDAEVEA